MYRRFSYTPPVEAGRGLFRGENTAMAPLAGMVESVAQILIMEARPVRRMVFCERKIPRGLPPLIWF